MAGATKLLTAGGGGVILTPDSSIASDVTVQIPASNCTVITTASTGKNIPAAALPAGTVVQTVTGERRGVDVSTTSGTAVSTGVYATITPIYANSKLVVIAGSNITYASAAAAYASIYRGTSGAGSGAEISGRNYFYPANGGTSQYAPSNIQYVDAPGSIATYTYTVMHWSSSAGYTTGWMYGLGSANYSSIVVMEIAQ